MKITRIETLQADGGYRVCSYIKISTDEGLTGWAEFYDGFSFGRFVRKHPHLKDLLTDVLIGDVFKEDVDVLWPLMDELRAELAASKAAAATPA